MPSSPSPWNLESSLKTSNIYRRPLGPTEVGFYWDMITGGVATALQQLKFEVAEGHEGNLSDENIRRAWLRLKQSYPILASRVEELRDSDTIDLVLEQARLHVILPNEVNFLEFSSAEEEDAAIYRLLNGPPLLSENLLSQLWVLRDRNNPRLCQFMPVAAHFIMDGMAGATVTKELLQELSLSGPSHSKFPPLGERLKSLVPLEELSPNRSLNTPRRRWRKAIASVILGIRKTKLKGGHTLPLRDPVGKTPTPAHSMVLRVGISEADSSSIVETCRKNNITFGNALPVLCQLAHSRILHRLHYKSGASPRIFDEEWEHRLAQPMHFTGPMNLRPYLDQNWYKNQGGASEICLAISFSHYVLPRMPVSSLSADEWAADLPPFNSLLSRSRFIQRSHLVKRQAAALTRHPLMHEFHELIASDRISRTREAALAWREKEKRGKVLERSDSDGVNVFNDSECIFANDGSTLGNRDRLLPFEYPIEPNGSARNHPPVIRILEEMTHLRCRPGEFYMGATTTRGRLGFFCYFDENVYHHDLVRDWVEEVRCATLHYLCQQPTSKL